VLRSYLERSHKPAKKPRPPRASTAVPAAPTSDPAATPGQSDLAAFLAEVRRHAAGCAHGWAGDRKAYISQVWRALRAHRPEWRLSEIEFKCMLAESHRTGQLALANADLKDSANLEDLQASAVVFKNTVFHFIRVEG
jgi:hypothetical protein